MQLQDQLIHYRARRTICEMLHDRMYQLVPFGHFKNLKDVYLQTQEQFAQQYSNNYYEWQMLVERTNNQQKQKLLVFCMPEYKTAQESTVIEKIQGYQLSNLIILLNCMPKNNQIDKICLLEKLQKCRIQLFCFEQLQFNITKNFLVPKHVILTTQQKEEMLDFYRIQEQQLPLIQLKDPVAMYLGLEQGQVVQIQRELEGGGKYINFRLCR